MRAIYSRRAKKHAFYNGTAIAGAFFPFMRGENDENGNARNLQQQTKKHAVGNSKAIASAFFPFMRGENDENGNAHNL